MLYQVMQDIILPDGRITEGSILIYYPTDKTFYNTVGLNKGVGQIYYKDLGEYGNNLLITLKNAKEWLKPLSYTYFEIENKEAGYNGRKITVTLEYPNPNIMQNHYQEVYNGISKLITDCDILYHKRKMKGNE